MLLLLLITLRFRHAGNVPLALLILTFSLRLGTIPTWNKDIMQSHPWLWPLTTTLPFLFGPLLFWTVQSLSQTNQSRISILHFIPYIGGTLLISLIVATLPELSYQYLVELVFDGYPPFWMLGLNGLKVIINLGYVMCTLWLAFGPKSFHLSTVHRVWIRVLAIIPFLVLIVFCIVALYPGATAKLVQGNTTPFIILAVIMSLLIYAISFLVLLAPASLEAGGIPLSCKGQNLATDDQCRELLERAIEKLDGGMFKNPNLSEARLARTLGVHPNRLSMAVNRSLAKPFRKLLNQYRIAYFQQEVLRGALKQKTILEVAYEAGFSAKSTFNRVFKEETGETPSEFEQRFNQGKSGKRPD